MLPAVGSVSIGLYATAPINISISYSKLSDFCNALIMQLLNKMVYIFVSPYMYL